MSAVLPTVSAHQLQKLPPPTPHLHLNPSGHLLHLLKPNDHAEALGLLDTAGSLPHSVQAQGTAPPPRTRY